MDCCLRSEAVDEISVRSDRIFVSPKLSKLCSEPHPEGVRFINSARLFRGSLESDRDDGVTSPGGRLLAVTGLGWLESMRASPGPSIWAYLAEHCPHRPPRDLGGWGKKYCETERGLGEASAMYR